MGKRYLWSVPAVLVLVLVATGYLPFISDDALISLRYAQRLLEGQGLTWTAGETVEGYSNLLWILLCAGLGGLGVDLIDAARALGYAGSLAALLAVHRALGAAGLRESLPAIAASLALALCGPIAVWTVGGLEQPLLAALLAWALATALPLARPDPPGGAWFTPGVLLALLCWTRPDGALFTAAACVGLLAARGPGVRALQTALRLAALPVLAYAAQLGFRLAYYGEWVPNSALAKLAFSGTRLVEGLAYVGTGLLWLSPLAIPALWLALRGSSEPETARRVRFLVAPLVVWTGYVAVIGGDSFPARRHLVPTVVVLAFLLAEGLGSRLRAGSGNALALGVGAGLLTLGLVQAADPENRRARLERWEWDAESAGTLLRAGFPADALLAVDAAGSLPFFSRLPAVDMLGINDRYLAAHRPEDFGRGSLGHELGDGRYVLEREPDLILFCGPAGGARPCFRSGREMVNDPLFHQRYRLVTLAAEHPRPFTFQPWVRAEGGRTGIRRAADRIEVPAYLLMATGKTVARLADGAGMLIDIAPEAPAGIGGLRLGTGAWRLSTDAGSRVRLTVGESRTRRILGAGTGSIEVQLPATPVTVDVLIEAPGSSATLTVLLAERSSG